MNFKKIKLEFFYLRKAIFQYKKPFRYIYNKYFFAKRISKLNGVLEKEITFNDLSVHLLTCHRDIVMAVWSLASFYQVSKAIGQLFIHDDGSLNDDDIKLIRKFFPSAKIINASSFSSDFSDKLGKYPVLKRFRTQYPNFFSFKKIVDPYLVSDKKMHLILDSDILWFKNPVDLETEIINGGHKSLMQKNNSDIFITFKDGTKLDQKLARFNAGIIFYSLENFDSDRLGDFLERIDEKNSHNLHFVDQVGHAFCLRDLEPLSETNYTIAEKVNENTIARHYTSPKRPLFYIEGMELVKNRILRK